MGEKVSRRVIVFEMPEIEFYARRNGKTIPMLELFEIKKYFFDKYLSDKIRELGYTDLSGRYGFINSPVSYGIIGRYELTHKDILFKKFSM